MEIWKALEDMTPLDSRQSHRLSETIRLHPMTKRKLRKAKCASTPTAKKRQSMFALPLYALKTWAVVTEYARNIAVRSHAYNSLFGALSMIKNSQPLLVRNTV